MKTSHRLLESPKNINLKPLSRTGSLSTLAQMQNERLSILSKKFSFSSKRGNYISSEFPRLPSEGDFNKLLNRLDLVISRKSLVHKKVTLLEHEPLELLISQNETQYIRIPAKDKVTPMTIRIVRERGSIITYVSKKYPEPSDQLHELVSKHDLFDVPDINIRFKTDNIFLALTGIQDSSLTILINFGRERNRQAVHSIEEIPSISTPSKVVGLYSPKRREPDKDFIQSNKKIRNSIKNSYSE